MSTVHADIAVVGAELCALAAGAALAHAGHRVVVIDDDDPGDTSSLGGLQAPVVPTLWRLPSAGPSVSLIDKLGLRQEAKRAMGTPEAFGVVDDPDVRMVFPIQDDDDNKELRAELKRVFGENEWQEKLDAIDYGAGISLLSEALNLHDDGFFARRREKKRVDDIAHGDDPAAPALRQFCNGGNVGVAAILEHLAPFVVHQTNADSTSIAGLLALARIGRGTLGGCDDGLGPRAVLRRLFLSVIQGHGGDVLDATKVKSVETSGRRISKILTSGQNDYAVQAVIDGTRDRTFVESLPAGRLREKAMLLRDSVVLHQQCAISRWALPRQALPRGLPARFLVLPHHDFPAIVVGIFDAALASANANGLTKKPRSTSSSQIGSSGKKHGAAKDDVFMIAAAFGAGPNLASAIDERLHLLFPFARSSVRASDHLDDDALRRVLPTYTCADPTHPLGGRRPRDAAANMARAGRDLAPRFGIEGELASAQSVASLVEQMVKK